MPYTPGEFNYSIIPFDAQDLSSDTADILSMRDSQMQDYLRSETAAIKAETTSLQTSINNIRSAPTGWGTWTPVLYRGTTAVTTSTVRATYSENGLICFASFEVLVTSTSSWPGGEVASISLPVDADTTYRQLGIGAYNNGTTIRIGMAFIESTTNPGTAAALIVDSSNTFAGSNPNIQGNRENDRWYFNLTYRMA